MNKNQQIYEILLKELQQNKYSVGTTFPSEYLLANRFQVGRCTINKAVSRLIQEGWLCRGIRGSGTKVANSTPSIQQPTQRRQIVFLGEILHNYSASVLDGIQQTAAQRNCLVAVATPSPIQLPQVMKLWLNNGVQGVITMQYGILPKDYPLPVIYIDEAHHINNGDIGYEPDGCTVATRNYEISKKMVKALLQANHREIAIYANQDYLFTHRGFRVRGMLDALREAKIPHAEERLMVGLEYSAYDAAAILKRLFRKFPKTTAIATVADDLALKVLLSLPQMKPSHTPLVTGFGNVRNITDAYNIPSVDQHPQHIGARACTLLLDMIEQIRPHTPFVEYVDAELLNLSAIHPPKK